MLGGLALLAAACHGQVVYNFGNPTGEEQLYLELANRARANPTAEGARLAAITDPDVLSAYAQYGVNLTLMQSEFSALPLLPPLAPNASLTTAARGHSAWMLATATQSHDETNPANTFVTRITAAGYSFSTIGENVFAYAKNSSFGHAGFDVDWGSGGTGGMLAGRDHRANIHSVAFREVGIGVVLGTNGTVGPQVVTQDFGTSTANPTFGTGVAYYDLNGNNFYDVGEGIAGLTVNVSGASYACTTAAGGGWTVPLPSRAATRTVSFSGLNLTQSVSLVQPASTNAKVDLQLSYVPPVITSAANAVADSPHTVIFNPVGGASAYKWNRWNLATSTPENCESLGNITTVTTGTYSVLNPNVTQQGSAAFHLENSTGASQSLQLNPLYYGQTSPTLSFQSCILYATSSEQFKVQVKEEGSLVWQDVYTQTGTNDSGETGFTLRSAPLPTMAGKAFRVRFLLSYGGGGYYATSGDIVGWFIDAIGFAGMATLTNNVVQTLSGTYATFTPSAGTYLIGVAPVVSGRDFPASYQTLTASSGTLTAPAIVIQPVPVTIASGTTATFSVATSGTSPTFQWYAGSSGVTTSPLAGATGNSYTTAALTTTTSYWVRATNAAGSADSTTVTATVVAAPAITTQPVPVTINSGATASFSVVAAGTALTFQWYLGSSGNTTNPLAGATASFYTTAILTSTTSYWLRVTNAAGSADSTTVTATVIIPPLITTQPLSVSVTSGNTASFTAAASGTSPTFQWYAGVSGNTGNPVSGATASTLTTSALTSTTSYWLRASNAAGSADSNTATATVTSPAQITSQPASIEIMRSSSTTLSVVATGSGTMTYQWYSGIWPDTSTPKSGATAATYNTGNLTKAANYWVRVNNSIGTADSTTAYVTVVTTATRPTITTQPVPVTITSGTTASFSVVAAGTAPTYQWYAGTSGVTTNPISGATTHSFTTPNLTITTSYWLRASNSAGSADSTTATATIAVKTSATVTLGSLAATYDGTAKPATATTTPTGLTVTFTYAGSATAPTSAGTYAVVGTINDANYQGSASGSLVVSKASATVTLGSLAATYNGSARSDARRAGKECRTGSIT